MTRLCGLGSQFEMLGSLQTQLLLGLTFLTFQTKDNLTCGLGLLVKDGLGLSPKTHLLGIVPTLSLGEIGGLAGLVLGNLVDRVLLALALAVGLAFFGYVHHCDNLKINLKRKKAADWVRKRGPTAVR